MAQAKASALDKERKRTSATAEVREHGDAYDDQPPTHDGDRAALLAWAKSLEGDYEDSTARLKILRCRLTIEIAAEPSVDLPPVTQWSESDYDDFTSIMKEGDVPAWYTRRVHGETWDEDTQANFKQQLKSFLTWLGAANPADRGEWAEGPRYWADDIEPGGTSGSDVEHSDLLEPSELTALWTEAQASGPRDELVVALPLTTWQRNSVLREFRIQDVDIPEGESEGSVRVNPEADRRKGMSGTKPLRWATGPVKKWVAHRRESADFNADPNDRLLCATKNSGPAVKGDRLRKNHSLNRRLRTLAERAGLNRDRWDAQHGRRERTIRAHLMRYTGATRAALSDDIATSIVKQHGWGNQKTDMLDQYIKVTDSDVMAAWSRASGINSDHWTEDVPEFDHCEACAHQICDWHPTCPNCGLEIGDAAPSVGAETIDQAEDPTEFMIDTMADFAVKLGVDLDREQIREAVEEHKAGMERSRNAADPDHPAELRAVRDDDGE